MNCNKLDCVHYKVCEEWKSLGNDNYINESNGNCDCYSATYSPSGDPISREALKKEVERIKDTGYDTNDEPLFDFVELTTLFKLIDNAPTIRGKDDEGR